MDSYISPAKFAKLTGQSESTVRRLADAGKIEFRLTGGGHRRIPIKEVDRFRLEQRLEADRKRSAPSATDLPSEWNDLVDALTGFETKQALALVARWAVQGMSIAELCDGPVRHAMRHIGALWPANRESILTEHFATTTLIEALSRLECGRLESPKKPAALVAGFDEDPYYLPCLMASMVARSNGFRDVNLGPQTPVDVIADAVEKFRPAFVCLTIMNPVRSNAQLRSLQNLAAATTESGAHLVVGGQSSRSVTVEKIKHCDSMKDLEDVLKTES